MPHPLPSLATMADDLLGANGSQELIQRLEQLLDRLSALPARLYLPDLASGTFYPVASFGAPPTTEELDIAAVGDGDDEHRLLRHGGEVSGLLETRGGDGDGLRSLTGLLGPILVVMQEREETNRRLRVTHEQMSHLLTAGQLLRLLDIEVLLVEIVQVVLKAVDAQVAAVLTPGTDDGRLAMRHAWGLRDDHIDAIRLRDGQRVVDAVFADGSPLLVKQGEVASCLDCSRTDAQVSGILCLPLTVGERRLGVVLLANPDGDFSGESRLLAQMVCDIAAMALDNAHLVESRVERERLGRELDLARGVQANMLPPDRLEVGGAVIAGAFRSADETGGDYFTYLERDGRLTAMIADVTGHGLGAALFTTAAHAIIQLQLKAGEPLVPAMRMLNQGLHLARSGRFMTAVLLEYDPATRRCEYFSAGHNPLLWIHGGTVRWLESHSIPLGIMDGLMADEAGEFTLAPGDVLVLYTDGFTEAAGPSAELLGEERFAAMVQEGIAADPDPSALVRHIFAAIDTWAAGVPQGDDLTLAVMRIP